MKRALAEWLSRNDAIYRKCLGVVERYRGDNQGDIATNGELRVIREFVRQAKCVFDVGANRGDWLTHALIVNNLAEYHCFEPSKPTFDILSNKPWPAGVILQNLGLSDSEGVRPLFIIEEAAGMNSVYNRWSGTVAVQTEGVQLTTLDAYCGSNNIQRIDFLKVDVEGHELNVIKGAETLLRSAGVGAFQFEYGGTYLDARIQLKDVYECVRDFNPHYSMFKVTASGLRPIPHYAQSLETFQLSNWLFKLSTPG